MARINNLTNFLTDVATAIKTKLNDNTNIPASQFDEKILNIETGGMDYENTNLSVVDMTSKATGYSVFKNLSLKTGVTNASNAFKDNTLIDYMPNLYLQDITDASNMFNGCSNLIDFNGVNATHITNMAGMYYNCDKLTAVPEFTTVNVTDMNDTFRNCTNLTNIMNLNTSNIISMSHAFENCSNLQNITGLNLVNATNLEGIFINCDNLSSDTLSLIANALPIANNLTNQTVENLGVLSERFDSDSCLLLIDKGYTDVYIPYNPSPNYHIIYS